MTKPTKSSGRAMSVMKDCIPIFTVLSDENRHLILKLLLENGKMKVNDITENLHLSRPAVSHHLKIMLQANAVSVEQIGKERFYALAMRDEVERLGELVELMKKYCPVNQENKK
ncbi:MAG: metalloregulator ArsR/SmtB family transcription factor [Moraxella sp.]|nr:metalloregulator ArsR/SmtB family transcription factor [Moraxella sp.]